MEHLNHVRMVRPLDTRFRIMKHLAYILLFTLFISGCATEEQNSEVEYSEKVEYLSPFAEDLDKIASSFFEPQSD